jgi:hypothetical protein
MRPTALISVIDATPVMRSAITSGITVIRIAFIQRVPIGATKSVARMSVWFPLAAMAAPPKRARAREPSTRALVRFFFGAGVAGPLAAAAVLVMNR